MKMNLRTKQILIVIFCCLLPFVVVLVISFDFITQISENEQESTKFYKLQNVASIFDNYFFNLDKVSQFIIGNNTIRNFLLLDKNNDRTVIDAAYNKALRELTLLPYGVDALYGIGVFTLDGESVISGSMRQIKMTDNEITRAKAFNGKWFWSIEGDSLAVCRLLRNTIDVTHHIGYMKLQVNGEKLTRIFGDDEYWNNTHFALYDTSGELLLDNVPKERRFLLQDGALHKALQPGNDRTSISTKNGADAYQVMSWALQDGKSILVCFTQRLSSRFNSMLLRMLELWCFLSLAFIIVQYVFISQTILRPLAKLGRLMNAIEKEDYSVRFTIRGQDEIARLATSFNNMSGKLQTLYNQVYQGQLKLCEAEIRMLQAQINPHFLFNTLDIVYWTVSIGESDQACKMIRALSDGFRMSLIAAKDGMIPLSVELEQTRSYLTIQTIRLRDKITYTLEVEDGLEKLLVVRFALQPLVENAIVHGLAPMEFGEVIVNVSVQEDVLLYSVYDNGKGIDCEAILRLLKGAPAQERQGMALKNIHDRIRLKFGEKYGVSCHQPADGGTLFLVRQPIIQPACVDAEKEGNAS
jgi:two-component system sensor histidine kinase YesM